jgi:hypothetical protein
MPNPHKNVIQAPVTPKPDPIALVLLQSGTNPPTVNVNQNDPGVAIIESSRNGPGNYELNFKNADGSWADVFVPGKTEVLCGGLSDNQSEARCVILGRGALQVFTGYDKFNPATGGTFQQGADDQMGDYGLAIKITVYP